MTTQVIVSERRCPPEKANLSLFQSAYGSKHVVSQYQKLSRPHAIGQAKGHGLAGAVQKMDDAGCFMY
jgi:hypothetical protein